MTETASLRTAGEGFYDVVEGVKTLHLKGNPYELGFQHGALLAAEIVGLVPVALDAAAAVIAKTIKISVQDAKQKMRVGKQAAEPFMPPQYLEEMRGIADGVVSQGHAMTLDEIVLWNTMYDQWCLYAHPHYSNPYRSDAGENQFPDGAPGSYVLVSAGCSSFSAWGDAVAGDQLVFGKNMDNLNLPDILENRILALAEPDGGLGHAFTTHPGMVGIDGGLNTAGVSMMTQYDAFIHETMEGCGIGIFTRLLLTGARSRDQAIAILENYPHCTGIAFHVSDAHTETAAIVNASADKVSVRYPAAGAQTLFTSNHTNCYPGWYGYESDNRVDDQQLVYELTAVGSIEQWQHSLRDPANVWVPAPSRFERYGQLMAEYGGKITPQNAITILSDHYDPYTEKTREKWEPSVSNNILATICALYRDDTFNEELPAKTFKAHVANLWSMVMTPKNGDFWIAIQDFPAQYGGYVYFNLNQALAQRP